MGDRQEKLDIVDENDNIIGQDTRENIHNNGLLHREIHVIIYNNQKKILFQKRSKTKETYPGLLDISIGGHVDLGEDYEETAINELEEESGISADKNDLVFIKKTRSKSFDKKTNKINNTHRVIYSYKYEGDVKDLKIEQGEADSLEFWSLDEILNLKEEDKEKFINKIISDQYLEIYKQVLNT